MQLSVVLSRQSNVISFGKTALSKVLSSASVEEIARKSGAIVRSRQLKLHKYVAASLFVAGNSPNINNLTLNSVFNVYDMLADESKGEKLSKKCVHKHLDSDKMAECMKSLLERVCSVAAGLTQKNYQKIVPGDVRKLLRKLNVKDIILIDGTEIDARPSLAKDEEFRGANKGRPHLDGEPSRPCIKLHVAYSVAKQTFAYIDVTNACESERAHVLTEKFSDCLIVADRGYVGAELEKKIAGSGNFFIIKGKSNTAGNIEAAFDSNSSEIPELKGKKLKEAEIAERMDFDISSVRYIHAAKEEPNRETAEEDELNAATPEEEECSREKPSCETHRCRIAREPSLNGSDGENVITLRTNLPRELVSSEQLFMLYRIRWTVEIFNKVCKSSNALHSINSGKKAIVYEFIVLSIMSNVIKTYLGYLAQISHNVEWMSMQKLNRYLTGSVLERFYAAILNYGKSKIYQVVNDLLGLIAQNCQRGEPSARDRKLLKDFPTLVRAINAIWDAPKKFFSVS